MSDLLMPEELKAIAERTEMRAKAHAEIDLIWHGEERGNVSYQQAIRAVREVRERLHEETGGADAADDVPRLLGHITALEAERNALRAKFCRECEEPYPGAEGLCRECWLDRPTDGAGEKAPTAPPKPIDTEHLRVGPACSLSRWSGHWGAGLSGGHRMGHATRREALEWVRGEAAETLAAIDAALGENGE